ncbi:MAG: ketol-acid reductoisomerase [Candidatus Krumholzibacteriota bacterium]|nr:ketol-acid reductoisomerase [Candidatus Krumholzibacteriota bacterium]
MKIYTDKDSSLSILDKSRIVVMGYGNQGRPQALNLRDSGLDVTVSARKGRSGWKKAVADGFAPVGIEEGARLADILLFLLPDELQGKIYKEKVSENLRKGAAISFAHGFSVAFGEIESAAVDLILVAPKGQGERLRKAYLEGSGLACLIAVANDESGKAEKRALAIASGLGCLRVGGFPTTFREEAVSDIFGEQAVLCGGVTGLIKAAYDLLLRRGFSPEVAYFECFEELKIIVDLFQQRGFAGMRDVISGTAAYGGLKYGEKLISGEMIEGMEELFDRIDSGEFARDWLEKASESPEELESLRRQERELSIERAGKVVRGLYDKDGAPKTREGT